MTAYKNRVKKYIGYALLIISVLAIVSMARYTMTDDIWYDEVFSVGFIEHGFKDIALLTARDVHPPFYYFYLKVMAGIISFFGPSTVTAAKLASILPWLGIFCVSVTYIKKQFGEFTMGLFMLLVTCMPQIGNYYVEIRMYSLALLMITAAGLCADSIIRNGGAAYKWLLIFVLGILTAYTQYYACIGIVGIYAALTGLIFLKKELRNKSNIGGLLSCMLGSVIAYIPWLPKLYGQATTINGNYWIQPLTLRSLAGCVKFLVLPVSMDGKICYIAAALVIMATAIGLVLFIKDKSYKEDVNLAVIGLLPLIMVILSGFILSAMGTPIFVYRYMIPVIGLCWLVVARIVDRVTDKRVWPLVLLIPYLLCALLTYRGFCQEEGKKVENMPKVVEALSEIEEDAVIIANFDHVASILAYYMDEQDVYLYEGDIDALIPDMFDGAGTYISREDVAKLVKEENKVYFAGSFNSREDILADWETMGIKGEEQSSVLCERYWFNIYRLENQNED